MHANFMHLLEVVRTQLLTHNYNPKFFATDLEGKICSPAEKEIGTLSFRGAVTRSAPTTQLSWKLIDWLGANRLITRGHEPRTKREALAVVREALQLLNHRNAA